LYLDLLGHFSAAEDLMALECPEDRIEAALFDLVPAFQTIDNVPVSMRVFEVHIELERISDARLGRTSFTAPEFHTAFVVKVKDPHVLLSQKGPWMRPDSLGG
jgi:hypothetical protein